MKRETPLLAMLVFVLATVPLVSAQDLQTQQGPVLPAEILGPQLIAWSQLQKPEPVPQPLPPPDRPLQQPDPQPDRQATNPQAPQQPTAQTFTGTIAEDGGKYILKVSSNNLYHLDDQERAKKYVGKQVKIEGTWIQTATNSTSPASSCSLRCEPENECEERHGSCPYLDQFL